MYRHILICTDGSDLARKGVDHGLALAEAVGARVSVVTVCEHLLPYPSVGHTSSKAYQEHLAVQEEASQRPLREAQKQARRMGIKADLVWRENSPPARGIVDTAATLGCDLIVLSSHGRGGLGKLLLGSVASEVLVLSPVPVLVVR